MLYCPVLWSFDRVLYTRWPLALSVYRTLSPDCLDLFWLKDNLNLIICISENEFVERTRMFNVSFHLDSIV